MAKRIFIGALLVLVTLGMALAVWGSTPLQPMQEATAALQSSSVVQVSAGDWITFRPARGEPTTGLVFYPGGRVDYRAYAPYLRSLAEEGYLAVLVPMPLNLAVFAPGKAAEVIEAYPQVLTWAVGGHSLGGAMAASYAARHPSQVQGLILLAAYPAESNSLAEQPTKILSISASQDGLATREKIQSSRALLPPDAQFITIHGGNHAQFGWYGSQQGDGEAAISRTEQQQQVLRATDDFLQYLGR